MNYDEWRKHMLAAVHDKMFDEGFVGDYIYSHLEFLIDFADAAYQYGRKEAEDGRQNCDAGDEPVA